MKKILLISCFVFLIKMVCAGVVCSPPSCSPPCGGACTYYVCENAGKSVVHDIKKLPYTTLEPANACNYPMATITKVPFDFKSNTYDRIPVSIVENYTTCVPRVNNGGACPAPVATP